MSFIDTANAAKAANDRFEALTKSGDTAGAATALSESKSLAEQARIERATEDSAKHAEIVQALKGLNQPAATSRAARRAKAAPKLSVKASDEYMAPVAKAVQTVAGDVTGADNLDFPDYHGEDFAEYRSQGNVVERLGWAVSRPMTGSTVDVPRQLSRATVGYVGQGQPIGASDPKFDMVKIAVADIAGRSLITRQAADDMKVNPTAVDRLISDLGLACGDFEEEEMLYGDGETGHYHGIFTNENIQVLTLPANSKPTDLLDLIIKARTKVQNAPGSYCNPNGILMSPDTFNWLETAKDANDRYIISESGMALPAPGVNVTTGYAGGPAPTTYAIKGISTAASNKIGGGSNENFVVIGAWNEAAFYRRQDVEVEANRLSETAWSRNMIDVRATERSVFSADVRPAAFYIIKGPGLPTE